MVIYMREVTLFSEFCNNIDMIDGEEGIVALNDIGILQQFMGFDFPKGLNFLFFLS